METCSLWWLGIPPVYIMIAQYKSTRLLLVFDEPYTKLSDNATLSYRVVLDTDGNPI